MNQMSQQLALAIQLKNQASLSDYCWNNNTILQHALEQTITGKGERFLYIWGGLAGGKSHLLQGACQYFTQQQSTAIYLPLHLLKEWGPESIEGIANQALIAIDDIDAISGNAEWEKALFDLYNQVYDNGVSIIITSNNTAPAASTIALADLRSRLNWGLVIQLKELDDAGKMLVLQEQARKRGFDLSDPVALFLIHRCTRNMNDLQRILDELDRESLAAQRKITIPFVKSILAI